MIRVVLFDLDGVIRHFDPALVVDIEVRNGLEPGVLAGIAFAAPLIDEVTTGRITRAEWVSRIGHLVGDQAAAEEWGAQTWSVDDALLELSDEIRTAGLTTAVLTNGTDTIAAELAASGIADHFDAIFNSADIGFAKPDVRAFQHVLDVLGVRGAEVLFTDDSASKLVGAARLSMSTRRFTTVDDLRGRLRDAGVPVRGAQAPERSGRGELAGGEDTGLER
ncbi:HAD-IA family hydrolase [Plantibacter sp. VKM Ac-2885]|uniref:HAD-IA family hydrolase n=1 Tax=Plantibacter sp. VKM Ac-2885 TaxID=2783828 RepID=UPI00188BE873|nr:HAD-IA family hydrolase [Plantibacter sp. VKM Ac-2885]MBF4511529.1 HAD-IA family hydrolase [Plantibacter sp. VKM Ac-2885]